MKSTDIPPRYNPIEHKRFPLPPYPTNPNTTFVNPISDEKTPQLKILNNIFLQNKWSLKWL